MNTTSGFASRLSGDQYLGQPVEFWLGIQEKLDMLGVPKELIAELAIENTQLKRRMKKLEDKLLAIQTAVNNIGYGS